jgi:transcriptional regulator with XRE-family HTH domain
VISAEDPALQLARRLRFLRMQAWPGKRITQEQLSQAFDVSVPLISSWERPHSPVLPPEHRLEAYASFFATPRSVERRPFRVIDHLTDEERAVRESLLVELTELRERALGGVAAEVTPPVSDNLWRFPVDQDITIVCSELPERLRGHRPFGDPEDPDYVELYRYSDLDSLFELYGHIRAMNPANNVYVRTGSLPLTSDEFTSHLVLLGGVDWNQVTAEVLYRVDLPIRQRRRTEGEDTGIFEVIEDGEVKQTFGPVLRRIGDRQVVEVDVAHFYRSRNPFNRERTVTICNGVYSRGVLGAVRALTDHRFRERNNAYAQSRFGVCEAFSIISRVHVLQGRVVTPDWTSSDYLLHEWSM